MNLPGLPHNYTESICQSVNMVMLQHFVYYQTSALCIQNALLHLGYKYI